MYQRRMSLLLWAAVVWALAGPTVGGCAGSRVEPNLEEPERVERLRLKITKVRNAIEETRDTIAASRGAEHLPKLYLRLAELLSEEARYHYQLTAQRQQSKEALSNVPQVRLLKQQAIDTYEMMTSRFEDHPLIPRVLFNLGHEQRELGNFTKMRAAFDELIEEWPESPLRNNALLVMGDHYFDRKQLDRSAAYYRRINRAELNQVSGLGHYKMGWVDINEGNCGSAIQQFERAISDSEEWIEESRDEATSSGSARQASSTRNDVDVRREALVDLTYCYNKEKEPENAVAYLRERAYDHSTFVAALDRLAKRYRLNDNNQGAVLVTRALLEQAPANRDRLADARTFYEAIKNRESYDQIGRDLELICETYVRFYSQPQVRGEERARIRKEFEKYVRDLATRAQKDIDGEDEMGRQVATAYRAYLDTFSRATNVPDVMLNLAEVLGNLEKRRLAGQRALQAAALMDKGDSQRNALYDAVVYFQNALQKREVTDNFERVSTRASLRRAASRLMNYDLETDRERRVKFAVARSYLGQEQYLKAINMLSGVAYEFPDSDEADAAIRLVLDAYDVLNDYDGLRFASKRFLQDNSPASQNLRAELQKILEDAQQRKIDQLSLQAAGDRGGDLSELTNFAQNNQGQDIGKRALINAFVAARSMGNTSKMYDIAEKLDTQYPESKQLPEIYTTVAQTARTRFEFERAIQLMERAASVDEDNRVDLLTAAGDLYRQLGLPSKAEAKYRDAIESAEGQQKRKPARQMAEMLETYASPGDVIRKLEPYADLGSPALLARLGLAYVEQGSISQAEKVFSQVLNASGLGPETTARAQYGLAETIFATIRDYSAPSNLKSVQKFISLVEVGQKRYLQAARQGSSTYTPVALSRLAAMLRHVSERLQGMELPSSLSGGARTKVRKALEARIQSTRSGAEDAIQSCADQLWSGRNFSPAVRKCLDEQTLQQTWPPTSDLEQGALGTSPPKIGDLRNRVAKNPEDVETLRKLGQAYLKAGNPHVARIAFAKAVQAGGGPAEQNLLGIARLRAGDETGAFEAFSIAAKGGYEAGRQNLATMLRRNGRAQLAQKALKRFPEGETGGRRLTSR